MKPYVAKKAISLILLFSIGGVGVSAAHAYPGKLESANPAPSSANKGNQPQTRIYCWVDGWRESRDVYGNVIATYPPNGKIEGDEVELMTPSQCLYEGKEVVLRTNKNGVSFWAVIQY